MAEKRQMISPFAKKTLVCLNFLEIINFKKEIYLSGRIVKLEKNFQEI